jgi:transcriptional regulator GlxA family with amidase domain
MKNLDFEIGSEMRSGYMKDRSYRNAELICDNSLRIEKTVQYMNQHLDKPLQASELAAIANISLSHFFALFKQRMGCSPMDYFTRLRMRRACDLLESTSARIKEIAAALGYDDPFYFSRVFKSLSAVAPLHYRSLGLETRLQITELLEPKNQILSVTDMRRTGLARQ